jgi:NAD+ kinase
LIRDNQVLEHHLALNDIVLYSGHVARMIEFEVSVDDVFVYRQRSDGLIVATPTGSTAYALSGGGPIVHPKMNALLLVPMHPHTLSSRPLVIDGQSKVSLKISERKKSTLV